VNHSEDRARIAAYYDRLVEKYGHEPQAADASSAASLEVRYGALGEVGDLSNKAILDVGCGFGGLGAYLRKQYPKLDYTGIDISSLMIVEGRRVYPDLRINHKNVLDLPPEPTYDVVLAQGIFYLLEGDTEIKAYKLIRQMFALAKEAVAFSALSTWAERHTAGEFYIDPDKLLVWCRQLTSRLVLRHDYHPGDVCVYMYKGIQYEWTK